MSRWPTSIRVTLTATVVVLAAAGGARAAVTQPVIQLPAFTRGIHQIDNGQDTIEVTFNWLPAVFSPPSASDQVDFNGSDLTGSGGGGSATYGKGADTDSGGAGFGGPIDGHRFLVTLVACQSTGPCPAFGAVGGTTVVDATPPVGTVQIDGGAAFTNTRDVTLDMTATDPPSGGIPGTASGVSQMAIDLDGNGTYPCSPLLLPGLDRSGCAVPFAPTLPVTLPPGDGVKTVGVTFGDAARLVTAPCPSRCLRIPGGGLLGNTSAPATDTIVLDTTKPIALVSQDHFAVAPGGAVTFDASGSVDQNAAIGSGVDPASATWSFGDGTPPVPGAHVTHAYTRPGTFVGSLTVADRAGNRSDPRWFSVTVSPNPVAVSAATGSTFRVDRVRVAARYRAGRLVGSLGITGIATGAGRLAGRLTPLSPRGRPGSVAGAIPAGPFHVAVALPGGLPPGRYRLTLSALGTTRTVPIRIPAPPQGFLRRATLTADGRRLVARFAFATRPAPALRRGLTVLWTAGGRRVSLVGVRASARIVAVLVPTRRPSGAVTATLRAGRLVVGHATARFR